LQKAPEEIENGVVGLGMIALQLVGFVGEFERATFNPS
jgi:hypothetical protein